MGIRNWIRNLCFVLLGLSPSTSTIRTYVPLISFEYLSDTYDRTTTRIPTFSQNRIACEDKDRRWVTCNRTVDIMLIGIVTDTEITIEHSCMWSSSTCLRNLVRFWMTILQDLPDVLVWMSLRAIVRSDQLNIDVQRNPSLFSYRRKLLSQINYM